MYSGTPHFAWCIANRHIDGHQICLGIVDRRCVGLPPCVASQSRLPIETWRPAAKELPVRVKLFPPGQRARPHHPRNSQASHPNFQDVASVAKQTPRKWRNGIHLPFLGCPISSRLIDTSHSQKEVSESNLRVNRIVVGLPSPWNSGKHQRLIRHHTHHSPCYQGSPNR